MKPVQSLLPHSSLLFLALAASTVATAQCEPDLALLDDGSGLSTDLVISEIEPGVHIEVFNTTNADITLLGTTFEFCSPFEYDALEDLAPAGVVPARGYLTLSWPGDFSDLAMGGEILIYNDTPFGDPNNIADFVCWGAGNPPSRKSEAEDVGKWSGACAPAITQGAIHRLSATTGTGMASYGDAAPSPQNCTTTLFIDGFESGNTGAWDTTVGAASGFSWTRE